MCIKNGMAHSVVSPFFIYRLQFYKVVQGSTLSQSSATLKHIFPNRARVYLIIIIKSSYIVLYP